MTIQQLVDQLQSIADEHGPRTEVRLHVDGGRSGVDKSAPITGIQAHIALGEGNDPNATRTIALVQYDDYD